MLADLVDDAFFPQELPNSIPAIPQCSDDDLPTADSNSMINRVVTSGHGDIEVFPSYRDLVLQGEKDHLVKNERNYPL